MSWKLCKCIVLRRNPKQKLVLLVLWKWRIARHTNGVLYEHSTTNICLTFAGWTEIDEFSISIIEFSSTNIACWVFLAAFNGQRKTPIENKSSNVWRYRSAPLDRQLYKQTNWQIGSPLGFIFVFEKIGCLYTTWGGFLVRGLFLVASIGKYLYNRTPERVSLGLREMLLAQCTTNAIQLYLNRKSVLSLFLSSRS